MPPPCCVKTAFQPLWLSRRGSCAHGVAVQPAYLAGSLQLLKKTSLSPLGLYEQTSDGWREVLL